RGRRSERGVGPSPDARGAGMDVAGSREPRGTRHLCRPTRPAIARGLGDRGVLTSRQSVFLVVAWLKHWVPIVTVRRVFAAVSFAAAAVNQRFALIASL